MQLSGFLILLFYTKSLVLSFYSLACVDTAGSIKMCYTITFAEIMCHGSTLLFVEEDASKPNDKSI